MAANSIAGFALVGMTVAFAPTPVSAQTRPALVRSVDEPARVPYFYALTPTCGFTNQCTATFPAVPAGKRVRVTEVGMFFRNTNVTGFLSVQKNNLANQWGAWAVSPINGAYYGALLSGHFKVDLMFEAGDSPVLEFGIPAGQGGIFQDSSNRLIVSGYIVDTAP